MPHIPPRHTRRAAPVGRRRLAVAFIALIAWAPTLALTPVPDFKADAYVGTWYEIAAMHGFLQSKCARDTQTAYTLDDSGAFVLHNSCTRADGSSDVSEARARPLDRALPAVLKVTGVHLLGIWWYPFGRESIVIARGPDASWIVLGHPSLSYARILSREPGVSDATLKTAANALADSQFDLCAFMLTPQTGGRVKAERLCDAVR